MECLAVAGVPGSSSGLSYIDIVFSSSETLKIAIASGSIGAKSDIAYEEGEPQTRGADHPNCLHHIVSSARLLEGNHKYLD